MEPPRGEGRGSAPTGKPAAGTDEKIIKTIRPYPSRGR
jgi:hypothetical protein